MDAFMEIGMNRDFKLVGFRGVRMGSYGVIRMGREYESNEAKLDMILMIGIVRMDERLGLGKNGYGITNITERRKRMDRGFYVLPFFFLCQVWGFDVW